MPTYDEWAEQHVKAQQEHAEKAKQEQADSMGEPIEGGPNGAETEEEQAERIAIVRRTMIFGDTDTTAGASATGTDVPSADNEGASVAAAEVDADQAEGDEDAEDVSHDEARRQVDVDAGTTFSAEEVDENAEDRDEDEGDNRVV